MLRIFLLLIFSALWLVAPSSAQVVAAKHARVELISRESSVTPGHDLILGVHFTLEKGWHIYWTNPGDSGEPPRVAWELPAGLLAGEILWPTPTRLGSGSIIDYGYEGRVLLMAPIETPTNSKAGDRLTLAATVKWLVCSEICIPERAHLTLALAPDNERSAQSSKWQNLFRQTRQLLPKPAPANWKVQAESRKDDFVLSVESGARRNQATFFPLEASQIQNSASQALTPLDKGFRLTLKKSEQLMKPIATLKGLIVLGADESYEIKAPVGQK
jgi:DsbC/DsbD-like thiol-disulfide interchange protein